MVRFILTKHEPVISHLDPIHAFLNMFLDIMFVHVPENHLKCALHGPPRPRTILFAIHAPIKLSNLVSVWPEDQLSNFQLSGWGQVLSGWGQVLSGWGQVLSWMRVLSWMQVLPSDASLVVGCKSCRRVKVGRARNTPLFCTWGNLAAEAGGIG